MGSQIKKIGLRSRLALRIFPREAGLASVKGLPLLGRTAVRPYKKNIILNEMTDKEDRPA